MSEGFLTTYHQDPKFLRTLYDNLQPNKFVRDGFAFCGWSRTPGGSVEFEDGASCSFEEDVTNLYAVWKLDNWTISYKNTLTSPPTDEIFPDEAGQWTKYNSSSTLPYVPPFPQERSGYLFTGWIPDSIPEGSTGNITFQSTWQKNDSDVIGLIVVPIVDMSGSMSVRNIAYASMAVTSMITQHRVTEENLTKVNLKMFYGTDPAALNIATPLMNINFSSEPELRVFNSVRSELIRTGTHGDEKMLSTFYAAISQIMTEITLDSRPNGTTAVAFSLITDERIISGVGSQLNVNVDDYTDEDNWWNKLKNDNTWIANWQKFDNPARLPDEKSSKAAFNSIAPADSQSGIKFYFNGILTSLKAMSYYYGINFGMCYAGDDCLYSNFAEGSHWYLYDGNDGGAPSQIELERVKEIIPYTLPANLWVKEGDSDRNGLKLDVNGDPVFKDKEYATDSGDPIDFGSTTTWKKGMYATAGQTKYSTCSEIKWYTNLDGKTYQRIQYPAGYPGGTLSRPMCRIIIKSGYEIATSRVMTESDMYTDDVYNKFHKFTTNGITQYLAYKYLDFTDISYAYTGWNSITPSYNNHNKIRLPSNDEIENRPSGKTLSGWQVVLPSGNINLTASSGEWWYTPVSGHVHPYVPFTVYVQPVF